MSSYFLIFFSLLFYSLSSNTLRQHWHNCALFDSNKHNSTVCDVIKTYLESFRYSPAVPGKAESRQFLPGRPSLVVSLACSAFTVNCFLPSSLLSPRQYECALRRRDGALPEAVQQLPARSPGNWFRLSSAALADTVSTGSPCLNKTV